MPDGCGSGVSKFAHGVFGAGGARGKVTPEEGCRARRAIWRVVTSRTEKQAA